MAPLLVSLIYIFIKINIFDLQPKVYTLSLLFMLLFFPKRLSICPASDTYGGDKDTICNSRGKCNTPEKAPFLP